MDVSSLIDLNSTLEEAITSVPLVPLPRINSPYEGDVSNDENNPFDWAVQVVSDLDDPFELVFKKAQELGSIKPDQAPCKDVLKCREIEKEMGVEESKNIVGIVKGKDKKESKSKCDVGKCQNKHTILNCIAPDVVQSANYIPCAQLGKRSDSPETLKPKYCSTPIHRVASTKRKLEDVFNPTLSKKTPCLFNISPASVVKARVERCIAEAEKHFKKQSQEREKLKGRQSLDSLMSLNKNSNYQRDLTLEHGQSLHEKYSRDFVSNDSKNELAHSLKNMQKPKNVSNFSEETFTYPRKVDSHTFRRSLGPVDDNLSHHEARFMATLFKATAEYREHALADESVVSFVDLDSEEEDEHTEKEQLKEVKEKLSAEFQTTKSENLGVFKEHLEVKTPKITLRSPGPVQVSLPNQQKNPATEKSSKSVMSKVLGKMQSFSPRKSTSSLKERNSVESSVVNGKLPLPKVQSSVSRSRSDSTIQSLRKKEQMEKPSKWALKEASRYSNVVHSPQPKQKQAVNLGRVNKPPKPLPKMFRNKKNLLTGKENQP